MSSDSSRSIEDRTTSRSAFWRLVLGPGDRGSDVDAPFTSAPQTSAPQALGAVASILTMFVAYGLAAGFFQGDRQLYAAALKFPLIISASLLLCLPSLYVFAVLAGAELTVRRFLTVVLGFAGRLAVLAIAMVPIVWLFSASTRYLFLPIAMHVVMWACALGLARPALAWPGRRSGGIVALWLLLLFGVALQVATVSRPVLLSSPGQPFFETGKKFFVEHFGEVAGEKTP